MATGAEPTPIVLPCDQLFRNLSTARRFAIDIGGSLAKLAYCSTVKHSGSDQNAKKVSTDIRLHFVKFETKYIESCLDFIRNKLDAAGLEISESKYIKATGGGAYKYADLIEAKLGLKVDKEDEMECLIRGCNFLLRNIPDESFTYHHAESVKYKFEKISPVDHFPYLLVNIGSGVSIIKVDGEHEFERVGGTSIGGGTFWGLGSLLTQAKGFDELLQKAEEGDHRNVDMLVSDIYGGDYNSSSKFALPGDLIASSFGRTVRNTERAGGTSDAGSPVEHNFSEADLAKSLLLAISNCIGQISFLYAQRYDLRRVYFGGFFIRGHPVTMRTISYAINYFSKGDVVALFLRHEGYLGAVGAFMKGAEQDTKLIDMANVYSWREHYAGSSGFQSIPVAFLSKSQSRGALIHQLEMDCAQKNLVCCPLLLNPAEYSPDTVDLTQDHEARLYWIDCFEAGLSKTVKRAISSQPDSPDAVDRAEAFRRNYLEHLNLLKQQPFAYGSLNVRSLLDLSEQLLTEYDFPDSYALQKRAENDFAMRLLPSRLGLLDLLPGDQRHMEVVRGLLAGNVFDWGAKEVVRLMESDAGLSFEQAESKLQKRPWLIDGLDDWLERLRHGDPHRCAAIFVDNSGADLILGVIPFALEMLRNGTEVILCANSKPALNDVTIAELVEIVGQIGNFCPEIKLAVEEKRLLLSESGQGSPCLDLRIDGSLAELMTRHQVDLLVFEGMGRAIHTNFATRFTCESLKVAVIKNIWLARRLGGEMFSVVFKYERPTDTTEDIRQSSLSSTPPTAKLSSAKVSWKI